MSQIRSSNTGPEKLVFDALLKRGYDFDKHYPIIGKPDIVFVEEKLAIFIDGEFWHGKYFEQIKPRLSSYWIEKITHNRERDKKNRDTLKKLGWATISIWDDDLKKSPGREIGKIENLIIKQRSKRHKEKLNQACLFSFFSGIGLLDLGFEKAGFPIKYVNEPFSGYGSAYKFARKKMRIRSPEYGFYQESAVDFLETQKKLLKKLIKDAKKTSNLIGFLAGPPCTDFSIGGKNRGAEGERGKLSCTYIDLVTENLPDFFVFENVKGLLSTKKHHPVYQSIKNKAHKNNYITTERLINALEYGAPQDRERIILIGFQRSLLEDLGYKFNKSVNALPEGIFPWLKYASYNKESVFKLKWPGTEPFRENSVRPCPEKIMPQLTVEYWFRKNNVEEHPNSQHSFAPKAGRNKFPLIQEGCVSKRSFKRLHRWRYSPTAAYGNNEVHLHPYKARRITAAEALAIQSLPKNFSLPADMTLTDMFKSIGNGVPFLAAKAIARSLYDFLNYY